MYKAKERRKLFGDYIAPLEALYLISKSNESNTLLDSEMWIGNNEKSKENKDRIYKKIQPDKDLEKHLLDAQMALVSDSQYRLIELKSTFNSFIEHFTEDEINEFNSLHKKIDSNLTITEHLQYAENLYKNKEKKRARMYLNNSLEAAKKAHIDISDRVKTLKKQYSDRLPLLPLPLFKLLYK